MIIPVKHIWITHAAAALTVLLGFLVLIGWLFDLPLLRSVFPGSVEMKPNTAVGLMVSGAALFMLVNHPAPGLMRLALLLAMSVSALGLATTGQYLFGWQLGIDELLFKDSINNVYTSYPGRMSPYSAFTFVCIGLALAALPRPALRPLVWLLAVPVSLIGLVSLVGYLWDASEIVTDVLLPPVAVNTAFGFILLGIGTFLATLDLSEEATKSNSTEAGIELRILAGFIATLLLLIIGGGYTYRSGLQYAEAAVWVGRTQQVRTELAYLYSDISDAETTQFVYLLIGDQQFDAEYDRLVSEIPLHAQRLTELTADSSVREHLNELQGLIADRIALLESNRVIYQATGIDAARRTVDIQAGIDVMLEIRGLIRDIDTIESSLLTEREAIAAQGQRQTLISLLITIAVMMGIFAYLFYSIRREAIARAKHRTELGRLIADLTLARTDADQANRAKSAFLAAMSHEIRTPMNGVIGMVEILARSRLNDEQTDSVKTIQQSAFALLKLIDEILDFSKIEAGRMELERSSVSLADLLEGICSSLNSVATGNGVELSLFIDPHVPEHVWTDANRLRQVIYNMVGNAIKFSGGRPQQQGKVSIRVKVDDTEPLRVAFSITDNGIGMTETTLDGLFVSFSQAETSTTRRFGGTGLGLAISKRLVDIMHGQIAVRSIPDAGSTFTVTLPFEIDNETPLRPRPDLSGLDGIIVSSHGHYDSDLCSYLEYAGMRVQLAHDLNSAIQQASDKPAPIVIHAAEMDITSIAIDTLHMAFSAVPDARHVVIIRGSVRRARVEAAHVVTMDGAPLRQRVLLRAVAVAAGRASPEIFYLDNGNDAGNSQIKAPSIAEARVQGRLILVAEDDVINQKVILKQLSLLGYAAEIAKDGVEALEMWHQGDYALLLTDLHMPNMDGYTLVQAIRRAQKHGQQRPVIALTANALKGEVLHAMSQGMDEYLTKPIQLDRLGAALEKWMPQMHAEPGQIRTPEASHADRESALVDVSILKGLVGDDEETVCNFLSDYLGSGLAYASELRAAFTAEDIRRIGDISHKLKSSSRSVGALTLGDLCAELENAARADDKVVLAKMMQEVEATLNAVVNEIDLILAKPKHGVPL